MDRDDLRSVLRSTGLDLWTLIETAISVAAADHGAEMKTRRDGFVERMYASAAAPPPDRCRNSESDGRIEPEKARSNSSPFDKVFGSRSPLTPQSNHQQVEEEEEDDVDVDDDNDNDEGGDYSIDQEQRKILAIKNFLEDPDQSDDAIAGLLQNLADMDITFKALKETGIGGHVNKLRKRPSNEVRRLVKHLVRKWKETVDTWVKNNAESSASPAMLTDGDSPQPIPAAKSSQNGHQVPDFSYSPSPHNGRLNSEEPPKEKAMVKREAPAKPAPISATPAKAKEQKESKESLMDQERLASARKRLQENYQEAQNAKKQRTIQVMDINEIPKPKNGFVGRNKGGFQAKHSGKRLELLQGVGSVMSLASQRGVVVWPSG